MLKSQLGNIFETEGLFFSCGDAEWESTSIAPFAYNTQGYASLSHYLVSKNKATEKETELTTGNHSHILSWLSDWWTKTNKNLPKYSKLRDLQVLLCPGKKINKVDKNQKSNSVHQTWWLNSKHETGTLSQK